MTDIDTEPTEEDRRQDRPLNTLVLIPAGDSTNSAANTAPITALS